MFKTTLILLITTLSLAQNPEKSTSRPASTSQPASQPTSQPAKTLMQWEEELFAKRIKLATIKLKLLQQIEKMGRMEERYTNKLKEDKPEQIEMYKKMLRLNKMVTDRLLNIYQEFEKQEKQLEKIERELFPKDLS